MLSVPKKAIFISILHYWARHPKRQEHQHYLFSRLARNHQQSHISKLHHDWCGYSICKVQIFFDLTACAACICCCCKGSWMQLPCCDSNLGILSLLCTFSQGFLEIVPFFCFCKDPINAPNECFWTQPFCFCCSLVRLLLEEKDYQQIWRFSIWAFLLSCHIFLYECKLTIRRHCSLRFECTFSWEKIDSSKIRRARINAMFLL